MKSHFLAAPRLGLPGDSSLPPWALSSHSRWKDISRSPSPLHCIPAFYGRETVAQRRGVLCSQPHNSLKKDKVLRGGSLFIFSRPCSELPETRFVMLRWGEEEDSVSTFPFPPTPNSLPPQLPHPPVPSTWENEII